MQCVAGPNPVAVSAAVLDTLLTAATFTVYVITLRYVLNKTPQQMRGFTVMVVSTYPVWSGISLLAVLVPRAHILVGVVTHGWFAVSLYQLFCLLLAYADGYFPEGSTLRLATAPCCCFPCCRAWLKPALLNRTTASRLRLLVLQLPLVQFVVFIITFVIAVEDQTLLGVARPWLQVPIVVSTLFAVWGSNMAVGLLSTARPQLRATAKFLALQLAVILTAMQPLLTRQLEAILPCNHPLTPELWANLMLNTLSLCEALVLSLWARSLYCRPLDERLDLLPTTASTITVNLQPAAPAVDSTA